MHQSVRIGITSTVSSLQLVLHDELAQRGNAAVELLPRLRFADPPVAQRPQALSMLRLLPVGALRAGTTQSAAAAGRTREGRPRQLHAHRRSLRLLRRDHRCQERAATLQTTRQMVWIIQRASK